LFGAFGAEDRPNMQPDVVCVFTSILF
jgi:hypothetical protein